MNNIAVIYINPWLLALAVIILVAVIVVGVLLAVRTNRKKVSAGKEEMIGKAAVVRTALNPKGEVFVDDELWTAVLDKGTAEPDEEVIITGVEGLKLLVTRK